MAGGERGVERAAQILTTEVRRTMQLLGVRNVDELGPQHVTLP
jgi:L-lactate dehydrogenase (cytochrome)